MACVGLAFVALAPNEVTAAHRQHRGEGMPSPCPYGRDGSQWDLDEPIGNSVSSFPRRYDYHRRYNPTRQFFEWDAADVVAEMFSVPVYDGTYGNNVNSFFRRQTKRLTRTSISNQPKYTVEDFGTAGVELSMELPGVEVPDLAVEIQEDNILSIYGRRFVRHKGKLIGSEFSRTFQLDDDIDVDGIEASLSSGILRVAAPRKQLARTKRRISIPIKDESIDDASHRMKSDQSEMADRRENEKVLNLQSKNFHPAPVENGSVETGLDLEQKTSDLEHEQDGLFISEEEDSWQ